MSINLKDETIYEISADCRAVVSWILVLLHANEERFIYFIPINLKRLGYDN